MAPFKWSEKWHKHLFFSNHRTGDGASVCFCIHCWHLCSGLPTGCCLPLLSRGSDAEGTDHTWVVLHPTALQPGSAGQCQGMPGQVLVHLLALSIDTFTAARRRHTLPGDWFIWAQEFECALILSLQLQFQYFGPADPEGHVVEPAAAVACCSHTKQLAALFLSEEPARNPDF